MTFLDSVGDAILDSFDAAELWAVEEVPGRSISEGTGFPFEMVGDWGVGDARTGAGPGRMTVEAAKEC